MPVHGATVGELQDYYGKGARAGQEQWAREGKTI